MIRKLLKEENIGTGSLSASRKWLTSDGDTHWHDFFELEYVIQGSGICSLNGREYPFSEGMLFFVTPADFHCVRTSGAEIINLMFSPELTTPDTLAPWISGDRQRSLSVPPEQRSFFQMLLQEIVTYQKDPVYCAALLESMLLKLSRVSPQGLQRVRSDATRKMCFYIMNHFRGKVSLESVAAYAGLTPAYASAVFKREMRQGFKAYLNALRYEYARKLLLYSDMTVMEVCRDSGFEDYPNFIRRFRQHFGCSPTQLRENLGK